MGIFLLKMVEKERVPYLEKKNEDYVISTPSTPPKPALRNTKASTADNFRENTWVKVTGKVHWRWWSILYW